MEIERKWVVDNDIDIKSLNIEKEYIIEQAYLFVDKNTEIRIRRKNDKYFLTQKSDGDLIREEFETPINESIYLFLIKNKIGNIINKSRYVIPYDDVKIELDVFDSGLMLAEIEFTTVEEANKFIPPEWFGEEVTSDKRFKNKSLACV